MAMRKKPDKAWFKKAYSRAREEKSHVDSPYEDAQDIYFPENEEFYKVTKTNIGDMDEKNKICYNDKIPESAERYSRQVEKSLFPRGQTWASIVQMDATPEQKILNQEVSDRVMEYLEGSNLYQEIPRVIDDLTIGTGCLKQYPTGDRRNPIAYTHVPLASVYALVDGLHRPRTVFYLRRDIDISQLEDLYGKELKHKDVVEDKYLDKINVIEVCHKMDEGKYYFAIWDEDFEIKFYEKTRPMPTFIFSRHKKTNSDDIWGWGLGMKKLPLAYLLNHLSKLDALGAERAIDPPYVYPVQPGGRDGTQAGSSNYNIKLRNGHVTPVAVTQYYTGGNFMTPLYPQQGYTIGLERIRDLEADLKQGFYIDHMADLPNQDNKYRTLGELTMRDRKFLEYFTSYYNNLERELVLEIFKGAIIMLQEYTSDAIIKKVKVDDIKVRFVNPVMKFRKLSKVREVQEAIMMIAGTVGQEVAMSTLNIEEFLKLVDEGFQLPEKVFYKGDDLAQNVNAVGQAKQEALMAGQALPTNAVEEV